MAAVEALLDNLLLIGVKERKDKRNIFYYQKKTTDTQVTMQKEAHDKKYTNKILKLTFWFPLSET